MHIDNLLYCYHSCGFVLQPFTLCLLFLPFDVVVILVVALRDFFFSRRSHLILVVFIFSSQATIV